MRPVNLLKNGRTALLIAAIAAMAAFVTPATAAAAGSVAQKGKDIVVVLHGLGRGTSAMRRLASHLDDAGYRAIRIGYHSLRDSPDEILKDIRQKIESCCLRKSPNLHFVGHSLGGLLIRAYLAKNKPANRGHVVLIGTPNTGTKIVDKLRDNWWFQMLGPMAQKLGTDAKSFARSLGPPDYPVGVIAGRKAGSANEALVPGEDDGLVSIESTKIDGMSDFVIVEANHSALRYDKNVVRHVVSFLKTGRFERRGR